MMRLETHLLSRQTQRYMQHKQAAVVHIEVKKWSAHRTEREGMEWNRTEQANANKKFSGV